MNKFLTEVLAGLNAEPKYLLSKYFYDETGDKLFQKIMESDEYYPTKCELEIFTSQTHELAKSLKNGFDTFDLIEMGAGDATKSSYLLAQLIKEEANFTYYPIDISKTMIAHLEETLPQKINGLKVHGLNGEYLQMLEKASQLSSQRKVVLFLGANIGNISIDDAARFCSAIRSLLQKGDYLMIGFDLKKNPKIIRAAYNDAQGFTKEFNLNLLTRINHELEGNFDINNFEHYPSYDPATGACKSYLISLKNQTVRIGEADFIHFKKDEYVFMEISQKYSVQQTNELAKKAGFFPLKHFLDSKEWFLDTIWECV